MNRISPSFKIAANTLYQLIGKASTMTITIVVTLIITRYYGREAYGQFSLMQSWPALLFIIVDFGLNAIATRELSKDFSKAGMYLGTILIMRIFLSAVFMAGLYIILSLFPYSEDLMFGIRLCLWLILTQALFSTANIVFQTKLRYDLSTLSLLSGYAVIFVLIILAAAFKVGVAWLSFSYVLGGLVTFGVSYYFLRRLGVHIKFSVDWEIMRYLFWQTLPLGIMFVFSQLNFKEDEILLSLMKLPARYGLSNTESVAVYALPYKIFEVALVVPTFFMNAAYPVLVRYMLEGKDRLRKTFFDVLKALFIMGIAFSLIGLLFSDLAINILGGSQFSESVPVLRILFAGLAIFYLTQPISWLIVTLGKQIYLPYVYLAAALVNLAANLIFIPIYSFFAAALVTSLSELLILCLLLFAAKKAWKSQYA